MEGQGGDKDQSRLTKKERRRLERKEAKQKEQKEKLSREGEVRRTTLKIVGGVLATAGAVGLGIVWPWEEKKPDLKGARPAEYIDPYLVSEIVALEDGYTREDIIETPERRKHLLLKARAFALYGGEHLSEKELVEAVQFLNAGEYDRRFAAVRKSKAYTNINDGKVYVREQHADYPRTRADLRKTVPFASVLTSVGWTYDHEWYHLIGILNKRSIKEEWLDRRLSAFLRINIKLEVAGGFGWVVRDLSTGETGSYGTMEEIFAYYMAGRLENKLFGVAPSLRLPDDPDIDEFTRKEFTDVLTGLQRIKKLFQGRPSWEDVFQKFHRESDLIGLGRFLAQKSSKKFANDQELNNYAFDLVFSLHDSSAAGEQFFDNYLASLIP